MTSRVRLAAIVLSVFLPVLVASNLSYAFKVDAHIWVAQQVLNDARDGRIVLQLAPDEKTTVSINQRYTRALRKYPREYLLGSLGPDAFPDVLAGQLAIHPSIKGGWGTAEFLSHLLLDPSLTEKELSFVLGYLSHAASDVFAHTFVNRYAGDLFELEHHYWAANRHIHIESYISKFLPPIDAADTAPANFLRPGDELQIPQDLMLRKFLLNDEVIAQFRNAKGARHLVTTYDLYHSLGDFLSEGGLLEELEQVGIQYGTQAGLGLPIARNQARELQRISNRVSADLNDFAGDLSEFAQDLNVELGQIEGMRNEFVADAMTDALDAADKLADVGLQIGNKSFEIASLVSELNKIPETIQEEVCRKAKKRFGKWIGGLLCDWVSKPNPLYEKKQDALEKAQAAFDELQRRRQELAGISRQAIKDGLAIMQAKLALRIELTTHLIALLDTSPFSSQFRRPFEIWQNNIPVALAAYTKANAEVIVNSIDPDVIDSFDPDRPGLFDPMSNWLKCYLPALAGPIPVDLTEGICAAIDGVDDIKSKIEDLARTLARLDPITNEMVELHDKLQIGIERLKKGLFDAAIDEGLGWFDKQNDTDTLSFYKGLARPASAANVNEVMSHDPSGQHLLTIGDTAERMVAEMHVRNGDLDPVEFSPVYDAIVLSKLALLDNAGLVRLARSVGLRRTEFGPDLYRDGGPIAENILFGFVQNIDGNHHWHDLSPPHPRDSSTKYGYDAEDFKLRRSNVDERYGYFDKACPARTMGMRMWVDDEARQKLFLRLFKGKIALGVDKPERLAGNFGPVLAPQYPDLVGSSDWSKDGATHPHDDKDKPDPVTYQVSLPVSEDGTIEILVRGERQLLANVKAGTTFTHVLSVDVWQESAAVETILRSAGGLTVSSSKVILGCDGEPSEIVAVTSIEVSRGDSLWRLAERFVGDGRRWPELFAANGDQIRNPHRIYPGQSLSLPWAAPVTITRAP
jgi:hypothetical protein